jgi:tRNA A37 threonylcarbamoyltransferase TsaD
MILKCNLVLFVQPPLKHKVLVETCDEAIGQENDHLKRKVKKPEHEVNKLKKQVKVQPI